MAWETGKVVSGVWIYRSDASWLNTWARFQGDYRGALTGWMTIDGGNREDDTAMLAVLSDARHSGKPVAVDIKCGMGGYFCVYGVSA